MAKRILEQEPVTITREVAEYAHAMASGVAQRDGSKDDFPFLDSRFHIACDENVRPLKHITRETERKSLSLEHDLGSGTVAYRYARSKLMQEIVQFDAYMVPASVLKEWRKEPPEGDLSFLPWLLWMFKDDAEPQGVEVTLTNEEAQEARDACIKITQRKGLDFDLVEAAARNVIALAAPTTAFVLAECELQEEHGAANRKGEVAYAQTRAGIRLTFDSETDRLAYNNAALDLAEEMGQPFTAFVANPDVLDAIYDKNQKVGLGFISATRDWMFRDLEEEARAEERKAASTKKAKKEAA